MCLWGQRGWDMTPVQYTAEDVYNAADLSFGLLQEGMPGVTLCFRH